MFEEMNRAIDVNGIKPVLDEKFFALEDVKEAYQYMASHTPQIFARPVPRADSA